MPRIRILLALAALALPPPAAADTITTGLDTFVQFASPDAANGTDIILQWDGEDPDGSAQPNQGLLKFDLDLDAPSPNGTLRSRILATPYFRARLRLTVEDPGDDANLHRMTTAFDDDTTWNSLGGGVQTSGPGQNAETISTVGTSGAGATGTIEIDVTADVLAWANGAANHGWAFLPTGPDNVALTSFEGGSARPVLILEQVVPLVTPGAAGSTWRYHDAIPVGDPSYPTDAQGDPWYLVNFDDSTWNSGTGQFGFGEGDETIVLDNGQGGGPCRLLAPCRMTYLFRTTFEVTEIPDELIVEILRDDAVKLYLNDVEVLLDNLTNPVDATTWADTLVFGADENTFFAYSLDPAALVIGTNTLAVEVHNWLPFWDNDLSFDLALSAIFDRLVITPEPGTGALLGVGLAALAAIRRRGR